MIHKVLDNDRFWTSQPRTLVQRYENILMDPVVNIEEIASHLGLKLSHEEASSIARTYSLESNLRRTAQLTAGLERKGIDMSDVKNVRLHDPHSLLHWNHIRAGGNGTWRDEATAAEREILARICGAWLVAHEYEKDVNWGGSPAGEEAEQRV